MHVPHISVCESERKSNSCQDGMTQFLDKPGTEQPFGNWRRYWLMRNCHCLLIQARRGCVCFILRVRRESIFCFCFFFVVFFFTEKHELAHRFASEGLISNEFSVHTHAPTEIQFMDFCKLSPISLNSGLPWTVASAVVVLALHVFPNCSVQDIWNKM